METRDWHAWLNLMPPPPDDFHVTGEVQVANPGVEAHLVIKEPQGLNPRICLLDLHLSQRRGMWPQMITWVQARYDKTPSTTKYEGVQVFNNGEVVATIKVDVVS